MKHFLSEKLSIFTKIFLAFIVHNTSKSIDDLDNDFGQMKSR